MASAASIRALGDFTKTTHSSTPPGLAPSLAKLPPRFTVCAIGSSRGIGEHIAYAYAHAGAAAIVVSARSTASLAPVTANIKAINPDCIVEAVACDITSADAVTALAQHVKSSLKRLDALVLNSGYSGDVSLDLTTSSPEQFRMATDVNYNGTYHVLHSFVPPLLQTAAEDGGAGVLLCVGSLAAALVKGPIANAQYCISKLAQAKLVEYAHEQHSARGLLAVTVHPGAVLTQMARQSKGAEDFLQYCTDSVELCGAFCVWLSRDIPEKRWLGGRLVSANWDVDELMARKQEIIDQDLLKSYFHA